MLRGLPDDSTVTVLIRLIAQEGPFGSDKFVLEDGLTVIKEMLEVSRALRSFQSEPTGSVYYIDRMRKGAQEVSLAALKELFQALSKAITDRRLENTAALSAVIARGNLIFELTRRLSQPQTAAPALSVLQELSRRKYEADEERLEKVVGRGEQRRL